MIFGPEDRRLVSEASKRKAREIDSIPSEESLSPIRRQALCSYLELEREWAESMIQLSDDDFEELFYSVFTIWTRPLHIPEELYDEYLGLLDTASLDEELNFQGLLDRLRVMIPSIRDAYAMCDRAETGVMPVNGFDALAVNRVRRAVETCLDSVEDEVLSERLECIEEECSLVLRVYSWKPISVDEVQFHHEWRLSMPMMDLEEALDDIVDKRDAYRIAEFDRHAVQHFVVLLSRVIMDSRLGEIPPDSPY